MFICQIAMPDFPGKVVKCVCAACGKVVEHRIPLSMQPRPEGWAKLSIQGRVKEHEYLICSAACINDLLDELKNS